VGKWKEKRDVTVAICGKLKGKSGARNKLSVAGVALRVE
jgi:hypothetical protein